MASTSRGSRSTGSRSRPAAGGRYAGGGGGGGGKGGNNAVAVVIAVGVLVAVVAGFMFLNKKDKAPAVQPTPDTPAYVPPATPTKTATPKPKAPLPQLPADIVSRAKALLPEFKEVSAKGTALFNEALKAKDEGDADTWQAKMEEARELMKSARDKWTGIEEEVLVIVDRAGKLEGWTEASAHEALFDQNLRDESRQVRTLLDEPLSRMAKSGRAR